MRHTAHFRESRNTRGKARAVGGWNHFTDQFDVNRDMVALAGHPSVFRRKDLGGLADDAVFTDPDRDHLADRPVVLHVFDAIVHLRRDDGMVRIAMDDIALGAAAVWIVVLILSIVPAR